VVLVALLSGAAGGIAVISGIAMFKYKDWLQRSSSLLGTRINPEKYPVGYAATRLLTPPLLLVWGVLMIIYAISIIA